MPQYSNGNLRTQSHWNPHASTITQICDEPCEFFFVQATSRNTFDCWIHFFDALASDVTTPTAVLLVPAEAGFSYEFPLPIGMYTAFGYAVSSQYDAVTHPSGFVPIQVQIFWR